MVSNGKETNCKYELFDTGLQLAYIDPLIIWINIHRSHKTDNLKSIRS